MKLHKVFIILVSIIIIIVGGLFFINRNEKLKNVSKNDTKNNTDNSYDLEKIKGKTITKKFAGYYMSPLVTVAEAKPEFNIELEGLDNENELTLINPSSGDMVAMEYGKDGKYHLNTKLDENIDYGILLDYRLVGSIRIVDDLEKVDIDKIYNEIITNLQCGL